MKPMELQDSPCIKERSAKRRINKQQLQYCIQLKKSERDLNIWDQDVCFIILIFKKLG